MSEVCVKLLCKKKQMQNEVSMKAELMNHEGGLNFMKENVQPFEEYIKKLTRNNKLPKFFF